MSDIITNGTEIKQRIISEINGATQCIYVAMAYFTDRDIATSIIEAKKNRNVKIDVILSSNAQNETVKQMLLDADISVHAFDTGDARGIMHHKFCLLDNKTSINGSYNYSYNASNNNVENIHVSYDYKIYDQFLTEFEKLKYNIDHEIAVNAASQVPSKPNEIQPMNIVDAFSQQLQNLVYSSAQISTEEYKKQGYDKSRESAGHIDIFRIEYQNIQEEIRVYATNDGLGSKKNVLTANISGAFESRKTDIEIEKEAELDAAKRENELEIRQTKERLTDLKEEKLLFETGNVNTGERGLSQINREIEKNKLEKRSIEQSFIVKRFWTVGSVFSVLGLCLLCFYLSMFFASAMYKVFFEGNIIRAKLEAGLNPGLPQIVDANAIVKIFNEQGILFGLMAMLFFVIPILLSNLELLGSKKKWVNSLSFWVGVLIFDVVVSAMVAINTDEIKSLLIGQNSNMQIWEVVKHGEFWLIFVFGMIPLIITHFLIVNIENSYNNSQREIVDSEKSLKIKMLDSEMIDLLAEREIVNNKIGVKHELIQGLVENIQSLEKAMNDSVSQIQNKYAGLLSQISNIYEDFRAKITSGKIFTDEILSSVISSYKSGFIEYLPEFYAENEVSKRVKEIEQTLKVNN